MRISAILSALAAATLVSAGQYHSPSSTLSSVKVSPGGYIIEYHDTIAHMDAYSALRFHQVDYNVRHEYSVFHGSAISVNSAHDGPAIAAIPGIKNVWPITLHAMPKVLASKLNMTDPQVVSDHRMTGVDIVHIKLKLTGRGVKVGVLDTGIDYKHPAFANPGSRAGCFGPTCRVAYGWDFVGDAYNGTNAPVPGPNPMDCFGHGTHVAGIIGANALNLTADPKPVQPFVGVAPEATLGAYRIFGCEGSSGDDVILAAMERAAADGMDIINMSLGGGSSYRSSPTAVLGDKLVARGVALSAAAGNDGSQGVWMVSDTGLGDLSYSVASIDNIYGFYNSFTYAGDAYPYLQSNAWGQPIFLPANATLLPLFESNGKLSDGCDAALYKAVAKSIKGKIVLVYGDVTRCRSDARGTLAKKAGAIGMLFQTTPLGLAALLGAPEFPMASIENKAGDSLLAAYKANPRATFTWSHQASNFLVEGGGAPSDFTSHGLDGELRSKPDIAAPGGNILSTYPLAKGGYALLSGTSMATPYVSGSHALYIQAKHTKRRGDEIRAVFKNTATRTTNVGSKSLSSVARQGAGLINVLNAILTTASISPDHIDLLDTNHLLKTTTIVITNSGQTTETFTLSHIPADALNSYPTHNSFPLPTPIIEADYATVSFSNPKVVIPAGQSATITLRFTEPKAGKSSQFPIYSGYIIAKPASKDGIPLHVPYTGLKGDFSQVPIMDTDSGFPAIHNFDLVNGTSTLLSKNGGYTFDMTTHVPVIMTRLGSHTPSAEIRIFESESDTFVGFMASKVSGNAVGPAGRSLNTDEKGTLVFSNWIWDGSIVTPAGGDNPTAMTQPKTLSSGTYRIVVASQKKFTHGDYPADYEVFDMGSVKF
ncbi:hypothetical protein BGZ99_002543 [Dissophora globulifera]|uniref:Uncharacterized protein n=1 Tax=Dissophora globulifera TaxID=979702 RepID=A0A9P6RMN0_9FUNG|nr:hypothetical protein BGZ99_002543 [Dissophora globulifera]